MKRYLLVLFVVFAAGILLGFSHWQGIRDTFMSLPKHAPMIKNSGSWTIYLTFDADMTPGMRARLDQHKVAAWYDPGLVKYLLDNKIPATIFVTGMFAELYPDLIKTLAASPGITIANHTYDHAAFELPCYGLPLVGSDDAKREEIRKTQDILIKLTGVTPKYFRYPGLCHNQHDDALVTAEGLTISDGDIISADAFNGNTKGIINNILSQAHDNGVVVMHLGGPNAPVTGEAVRAVVPQLTKQGFSFSHL